MPVGRIASGLMVQTDLPALVQACCRDSDGFMKTPVNVIDGIHQNGIPGTVFLSLHDFFWARLMRDITLINCSIFGDHYT